MRPPARAHLLARLLRHPESCIHAVQAARGIPPVDLSTLQRIDPPIVRILVDDEFESLHPDLSWSFQFGPHRARGILLADAIERLELRRIWTWPRLRAGVRLQQRCPTWMLVHSPRESTLAAIEAGFLHQRELMPILLGPERARPARGRPTRPRPELDPKADPPRARLIAV